MVDIPVNPEVKELPPLSDAALFKMYSGLEVPNFAAIRSMVREIQTARALNLTNRLSAAPNCEISSGREPHKTRPVLVWADVDLGIAEIVEYLNTIPGVRTCASCQGTIGERGPAPYRAYVLCDWTAEVLPRLQAEFDVEPEGNGLWGHIHPREAANNIPTEANNKVTIARAARVKAGE